MAAVLESDADYRHDLGPVTSIYAAYAEADDAAGSNATTVYAAAITTVPGDNEELVRQRATYGDAQWFGSALHSSEGRYDSVCVSAGGSDAQFGGSGGGHAGKGSAHKYNNNNTSGYVNEEIILAQARLRAARETLRRDGDSYNGYAAVATTTAAAASLGNSETRAVHRDGDSYNGYAAVATTTAAAAALGNRETAHRDGDQGGQDNGIYSSMQHGRGGRTSYDSQAKLNLDANNDMYINTSTARGLASSPRHTSLI